MKTWFAILAISLLSLLPSIVVAQPDTWRLVGLGGGKPFGFPVFSPHDRREIYLNSGQGGIFHSLNLGDNWSTLLLSTTSDLLATDGIGFTSDPTVLYAVVVDAGGGLGIGMPARSNDAGQSWTPLPVDAINGRPYSLVSDPNATDRILVTDYSRLFLSENGGTSYTQVDQYDAGYRVSGAFFNGDAIYLGTNIGVRVSPDRGRTWSPLSMAGIPPGVGLLSFAGARRGESLRLFCVAAAAGDIMPGITPRDIGPFREVYTLESGGIWKKVSGLPDSFHPFFVSAADADIDVAYLAGNTDAGVPAVYKTTDGGATWRDVFRTSGNANIATGWCGDGGDRGWDYAGYATGFAVDPRDGNRAIITDLATAHLTTDGGATWRELYTNPADANPSGASTPKGKAYRSNGLENSTSWHLLWADASTILAGGSGIAAMRSVDDGASWSVISDGLTLGSMYHMVRDPSSGLIYGATASIEDIYRPGQLSDNPLDGGDGEVVFSSDKGKSWRVLHDFGRPVVWLALDSTRPNRMYAAVVHGKEGGIYVSSDIQLGAASTWTRLAAPPRTEGHPSSIHLLKDGSLLASYTARFDGARLTTSSGIFLSTDGGASWVDRSLQPMVYYTRNVAVDPHDPTGSTWYAELFTGLDDWWFGYGGIYRTTNQGQTWQMLADQENVTSCAISPASASRIYVSTTSHGILYPDPASSSGFVLNPFLPYPYLHPEGIFFNPHMAGDAWITNYGGGIRRGDLEKLRRPAAPQLIAPVDQSRQMTTAITLRWESIPGATGYDVRVGTSPDLSRAELNATGTQGNTREFQARLGETYYWDVRASIDSAASIWSPTWRFTATAPAGVSAADAADEAVEITVRAMPNPASSRISFTVTLGHGAHATLRLVSPLGAIVAVPFEGELDAGTRVIGVDVGELASGCYRYELITDRRSMGGQVVIAR